MQWKRSRQGLWLFMLLALLWSLAPSHAQQDQPQLAVRILNQTQTEGNELHLRFTALDSTGTPLSILSNENVALQVNGIALPPLGTPAALPVASQTPLTLIIVADVTDSLGSRLTLLKNQTGALLDNLKRLPNVQVGVISFADVVTDNYPISSDLDGAKAAIQNLEIINLPPGANIMVRGVERGVELLSQVNDPNRRYALVLVTDATATADQSDLAGISAAARAANIAFYSASLPTGTETDISIPQFFAQQTGGFAHAVEGRGDNALNASLATKIAAISDALTSEFEATFNLDVLSLPSDDYDVQLVITQNQATGQATSEFSYVAADYSFTFAGLTDPEPIPQTGEVNLALTMNVIPPNTTVKFILSANGDSYSRELCPNLLTTAETTALSCPWNTNIDPAGLYQVTVTLQRNGIDLATNVSPLLNVYREISVLAPTPLTGETAVFTLPQAYPNAKIDLYLAKEGAEFAPATSCIGQDARSERPTLTCNIEAELFSDPATPDEVVVDVRLEIRDAERNFLLARWEANDMTAQRQPRYTLNLNFSPAPATPLQIKDSTTLQAQVAPALRVGSTLQFFLTDAEGSTALLTTAIDASTFTAELNPAQYPPGLYQLEAFVVNSPTETRPQTAPIRSDEVNLYRTLDSTAVTFSPSNGNILRGETQILVNTSRFPAAQLVAASFDGTLINTANVGTGDSGSIVWNIAATAPQTVTVQVDVLGENEVLLGRWEEQRELHPTATYNARFGSFDSGAQVTGAIPLDLALTPALAPGDSVQLLLLNSDGNQIADLSNATSLNTADYAPGRYTLVVNVTSAGQATRLGSYTLNFYRQLPDTQVQLAPRKGMTLTGRTTVTVSNTGAPAALAVLRVDGQQIDRALFQEGIATLDWNIDASHFNETTEAPPPVTISVELYNEDETSRLYVWQQSEITLAPSIPYTTAFVGLSDDKRLTSNDLLTVQLSPTPPETALYTFTLADGTPLCPPAPQASCALSTLPPGVYTIQTLVDDGGLVLATLSETVNIYRLENQIPNLPPVLAGEIAFPLDTQLALPNTAILSLELHASANGSPLPIQTYPVDLSQAQTLINWQVEQLLFAGNSTESATVDLQIDLVNRADGNSLLVRWQQSGLTAQRIPLYNLTLGDLTPASNGTLYLAQGVYPTTLRLNAGVLPNFAIELTLVNPILETTLNPLPPLTQTATPHTLDTNSLAPGLYNVQARLLNNGQAVGQVAVYPSRLNVYQPLPATSITFDKQLVENGVTQIKGSTTVTVNAAGVPEAETAILYANDQEMARTTFDRNGAATLAWEIDTLYFTSSDDPPQEVKVRVDVRSGESVLARWEEARTIAPGINYQISFVQLTPPNTNEIFGRTQLDTIVEPINSAYIYVFTLIPADVNNAAPITPPQDGTAALVIDPSQLGLTPGNYLLRTDVNLGTQRLVEGDETPIRLILPLELGISVRGEALSNEEISGTDTYQVSNLPNARRIQVEFKRETAAAFEAVQSFDITNPDEGSTEIELDWQKLYFNSEDSPEKLAGELRLQLVDDQDRALYRWQAPRALVDSGTIGIIPALKTIVPLILVIIVLYLLLTRFILPTLRDRLQPPTTIQGEPVLICWNTRDEMHDVEYLGPPVIYIGRATGSLLPWEREPHINIPDRAVNRRVGKIILKNGKLTFVAETSALDNLSFLRADQDLPRKMEQSPQFNKKSSSVPLDLGDTILIGRGNAQWKIQLSPPDNIGATSTTEFSRIQ